MYHFKLKNMNAHNVENVSEIEVIYRPAISDHPVIKSSLDSYNVLKEFIPENTIALKEHFVVLYLNRANKVIGGYKLSEGDITGTVVDLRLLFSIALKSVACNIIIGHNHPSGNLTPSKQDIALTQKIKDAGFMLDISLVDHIILTPDVGRFYSFSDEGIL
jgi:DNA repair protein RadC